MFSITLTIHNKDFLLERVLESIKKHTRGSYEINLVLDGCSDGSEKIADNFIIKNDNIKINKFTAPDVYETKANNIGLKNSSGDYCIIIQDDMIINEENWNLRLLKPIKKFSDVFAVTARAAHNWNYNPHSPYQPNTPDVDNAWCNLLYATDLSDRSNTPRNVFSIRNSVNRGPLLIKHDILEKVNYLNEDYAPLEMDDHDLNYRVYKQLGLVCGCYWIDYISNLEWGGTRSEGTPKKWHVKAQHKNFKLFYKTHEEMINGKTHNQERIIPE